MAANFSNDIKAVADFEFVGAVHVEAVVGQKDGGVVIDPIAETHIVVREASKLSFPVRAVAYVNLTRPDAAAVIREHSLAAPGDTYLHSIIDYVQLCHFTLKGLSVVTLAMDTRFQGLL